jgi:cysteine desulfurase
MNACQKTEWSRLEQLKVVFQKKIKEAFPFVLINGHPCDALSHILNISFDSARITLDGEALLFNLDLNGIAVTSGSACTSGSMDPSHVLLSIGRDAATAKASIRFSMGKSTTLDDIEYTVETLKNVIQKIASPKAGKL